VTTSGPPSDGRKPGEAGVSKSGGVSGDKMPLVGAPRANRMKSSRYSLPEDAPAMARKAAEVLRLNDMRGWTKAAPELYPHQWSWDSAFIAIGLAHLDTRRAARELETLFAHQWKTGKVPHIVFNEEAPPESYFPGPEHWACAAASPEAPPAPPYTSCLSQPPVHAISALRIWEAAQRGSQEETSSALAFLKSIYPGLLSWHQYLLTYRDPQESGLVTIYHPWGSGTDNSPRWDAALQALEVGEVGYYPRYDLQHVGSPAQRPTNADYDRYLWLVNLIKRAGCDEATIYASHPFLVKDVLTNAILVAANEALLEISELVEAQEEDRALIADWMARGRRGLEECWDSELGLCLDYDLRADRPLRVRTVAGFAPLIAGGLSQKRLGALLETLDSPAFLGHRGLRWPLSPSTSPEDPRFNPRSYWRGPTWPVFNWLLWWSLVRAGEHERAERLREAALDQLAVRGFGEYFDPFTGQLLGSADQSWTAAVALDWLAYGPAREERLVS
jgi:glucosylglycerate hydrolase